MLPFQLIRRRPTLLLGLALLVLQIAGCSVPQEDGTDFTLISGGTLVDIENLGRSQNDIQNACVLLEGGDVSWVGPCEEMGSIPDGTVRIDALGKYVLPGLVDGFAAINNQSYCNAYLYMGVTSILSVDGGRRGAFFGEGDPTPKIFRLEGVGRGPISDETVLTQIDSLADAGFKVALLMYGLTPDQISLAIKKSKERGMATIGELGHTTYEEGIEMGFDAFVHTTRYSLDMAPRDMAEAVANHPFSNDLESAKWKYYKFLSQLDIEFEPLHEHASNLGAGETFIMPTSSLSYLDLPDHKNPWDEPVASILNIDDINRPADPATGNHSIDSVEQAAYSNLVANEMAVIEPTYYKNGAKYLAGSGTDVWGTMPGISLHTELWILHTKIGLTKREALAAATANFNAAFGWEVGRLAPGFSADVLILNSNPLDDLENLKDIDRLFLKGQEIDRKSLLQKSN